MKGNKTEQRVWQANVACLSLIIILTIILAVRFNFCDGCGICFAESMANRIMLYALGILCVGYIASVPVMIYKVRQSKRNDKPEDCDGDDNGFSY